MAPDSQTPEIPADQAQAILDLAARLSVTDEGKFSVVELHQIAQEADISAEHLEHAIAQYSQAQSLKRPNQVPNSVRHEVKQLDPTTPKKHRQNRRSSPIKKLLERGAHKCYQAATAVLQDLDPPPPLEVKFRHRSDWERLEEASVALELTLTRKQWQQVREVLLICLDEPKLAPLPTSCPSWKLWKQFESVTVKLTLTRWDWHCGIHWLARKGLLGYLDTLREQLQEVIKSDDVAEINYASADWVLPVKPSVGTPIRSHDVVAITYDSGYWLLQFEFRNGERNRYLDVPPCVVQDSLEDFAKGHYFRFDIVHAYHRERRSRPKVKET